MKQSHARRARAGAIASAAVTVGLLAPSAAHAAVGSTSVTNPAPERVLDSPGAFLSTTAPGELRVDGVAPGAVNGDEVNIVCTYTLTGATIAVELSEDPLTVTGGAFGGTVSVPTLPCRIRAVPTDTPDSLPEDADLSAYAGPRVLAGGFSSSTDTSPGSPTFGAETFATVRGQSKGLNFVVGLPSGSGFGGGGFGVSGGVYLTALLDDTYYRPLFGPTAFLTNFRGLLGGGAPGGPMGLDDVGLVVDGRGAVPVASVGARRSKVVSRTFDPVTADQTIVEDVPIALYVLDGDGRVTGLEDSGLSVRRTTAQNGEGRRISVGDVFSSTDGAAHRIEVRYLQSLYSSLFGDGGGTGVAEQEPASFRFPWSTGDAYVSPTEGEEFGPAPAGPTTILVHGARQDYSDTRDTRAARRADEPLLPRAEGAFQFDSAPSSVKFIGKDAFAATFVRDVPAGGSAGVSQTLLQDLTQAGLDGLITPPSTTPPAAPPAAPLPITAPLPTRPPAPPASPFNPLPTLARSTGRVLLTPAQGRRLRDRKPVTVTTKGMPAGRYGVTIRRRVPKGRTIASGIRTIKKDGTLQVTLRLSKYGKRYLAQKKTRKAKSVPVRVIVTWTPPGKGRQREQTSYPTNFR